jgi:hypothetical protein
MKLILYKAYGGLRTVQLEHDEQELQSPLQQEVQVQGDILMLEVRV